MEKVNKIKLFDYQEEVIEKLFKRLSTENRFYLQMPKGSGKTFTISHIMLKLLFEELNQDLKVKKMFPFSIINLVVPANKREDWFYEFTKYLLSQWEIKLQPAQNRKKIFENPLIINEQKIIFTKRELIINGIKIINKIDKLENYDKDFLINIFSNQMFTSYLKNKEQEWKAFKKNHNLDYTLTFENFLNGSFDSQTQEQFKEQFHNYYFSNLSPILISDESQNFNGQSILSRLTLKNFFSKTIMTTGGIISNDYNNLYNPLRFLDLFNGTINDFIKEFFNYKEMKLYNLNRTVYLVDKNDPISFENKEKLLKLYKSKVIETFNFNEKIEKLEALKQEHIKLIFDDFEINEIIENLKTNQFSYIKNPLKIENRKITETKKNKTPTAFDFYYQNLFEKLRNKKGMFEELGILKKKTNSLFNENITNPENKIIQTITLNDELQMRQLSSGFVNEYNIVNNLKVYEISRKKIEKLNQLIQSKKQENLIIFYNFNKEKEMIEEFLEKNYNQQYKIFYLNGNQKNYLEIEKEKSLLEKEGKNYILLTQYFSGSTGIDTLQFHFNHIIYYSLPQSASDFSQSMKRIHRLGQNKECYFYYLLLNHESDLRRYDNLIKSLEKQQEVEKYQFQNDENGENGENQFFEENEDFLD